MLESILRARKKNAYRLYSEILKDVGKKSQKEHVWKAFLKKKKKKKAVSSNSC